METIETQWAPMPDESAGDYFIVDSANDRWLVSLIMARHLESMLDRLPPPEWVAFVDLFGARVRVRTVVIQSVIQSTSEQRAASRDLLRRLERERRESGRE